jgi:hypothetical protein
MKVFDVHSLHTARRAAWQAKIMEIMDSKGTLYYNMVTARAQPLGSAVKSIFQY